MKFSLLGVVDLIVAICFFIKPELLTNNHNLIFGIIFITLSCICFTKEDRRR